MPYAGPRQPGSNPTPPSPWSPPASRPTHHSTSKAMRSSRPAAAAASAMAVAKRRWQAGWPSPSWVKRSTGAHAQPGMACSSVRRSRSGNSRRSPTGPPMEGLAVAESSLQYTSNTGDMPTPQVTAASRRATGTALTRVIPALST